jgi:hypothetical protein
MSLPPQAEIPQQLSLASAEWTKLRRMASYAAFDGWTLTILGGLTLICGGYGSVPGLFISSVLLGTGLFEIHCVRQLRRLNPPSITHMGYNQIALAAGLILYSMVSLIQSRGGAMPSEITDAIAAAGGSTDELKSQLSSAMEILYGGVIAFALLVQGGTALYYFSRRKYLQRYINQTPDWIQQMQRERGEISL